jgi:hypothetical protein
MTYRVVKLRNGKHKIQGRMIFWFWLDGIWNGISYEEREYDSIQEALEHLDEVQTKMHAHDMAQIVGVIKRNIGGWNEKQGR